MCIHYYIIDSANKGKCKFCPKVKDFQPAIDKFFGDSKGHKITKTQLLRFEAPQGDYPMKGKLNSRKYIDRLD